MFRRLAVVSLLSILAFAASARAEDEAPAPTAPVIFSADSSKAVFGEAAAGRSSKAVTPLDKEKEDIRLAMCGLEADSGAANLDAGLIDFNVPDPARAAGRSSEDSQRVGQNVPDYRSSVFLGVTLGYHF